MRMRKILLGLMALLLLPLFTPTPASALSCIDPVSVFDSQDVVVRATVTNRPVKDQIIVAVDRYYKGTGPAAFQAAVQGIDPKDPTWMNDPQVGTSYILGFVSENGKLVHRPCDLFFDLTSWTPSAELNAKLGEGTKPNEGTPPTGGTGQTGDAPAGGLPWRTILPVAGATLLLAGGVGLALRMRRR